MKKCRLTVTALCLSALMLFSPTVMKAENPFMAPYGTPFNMPPFDKISNSDYLPAFEEGIRQHNQEIEAIINNRAVADFDNTIAALDNAGQLLENVTYVFNGIYDACSTPELQTLGEQILPMLSKHNDEVMMNERLFSREAGVCQPQEIQSYKTSGTSAREILQADGALRRAAVA